METKKNIAIGMYGQIRCFKICKQSLINFMEYLTQYFNVHLFNIGIICIDIT